MFFSCIPNDSILYPRPPENWPFYTVRFGKLLTPNWPSSAVHTVSWGKDIHTEHCSFLHVQGQCQSSEIKRVSILLQYKNGSLTKKRRRKHKSRGTKRLVDAWKDSIPSESHVETATLTPGANSTASQVTMPSPCTVALAISRLDHQSWFIPYRAGSESCFTQLKLQLVLRKPDAANQIGSVAVSL